MRLPVTQKPKRSIASVRAADDAVTTLWKRCERALLARPVRLTFVLRLDYELSPAAVPIAARLLRRFACVRRLHELDRCADPHLPTRPDHMFHTPSAPSFDYVQYLGRMEGLVARSDNGDIDHIHGSNTDSQVVGDDRLNLLIGGETCLEFTSYEGRQLP